MARNIGSWWIKDGIDGRRIEAQGFASTLDAVAGFDWTEDHGDSDVLEKDFVETANYTERVDNVDAVQMSSHGNPDARRMPASCSRTRRHIQWGVGAGRSIACTTCAASTIVPTAAVVRTRAGSTLPCMRHSCTR